MLIHLVTVFVVTLGALLCAWLIYRTLKRPMPGFLIPMLIGGSVITYGIYSEYTWASRTQAQMPESLVVVHEIAGDSMFSPWAKVFPRIDRLSVIDTQQTRTHPAQPGLVLVELHLLQRFYPTRQLAQMIDCPGARRADLSTNTEFTADGLPDTINWTRLDPDHPLITAACASS